MSTDYDIVEQKHFDSMEVAGKANVSIDYTMFLKGSIGADKF